jgi:hypothetical protein
MKIWESSINTFYINIINKVLGLAVGYKVSLFKENLKLRREEGGVVLKAYKVTLDTILPHRLPNQA